MLKGLYPIILWGLATVSLLACSEPTVVTPSISPTLTTPKLSEPTGKLVPTVVPTAAATLPPTATPTPLPTYTPYPTYAPLPTPTPYPTYAPLPTPTPYPTHTPLPTYTPYPTYTPPPPTPTPMPTVTPMPEPTSEPVLGSRDNPVPFGQAVEILYGQIPYWAIVVSATNPNANKEVLAAYRGNDPPKPGNQFFMVELETKYLGPESATFNDNFSLGTMGQSAVVYGVPYDSPGGTCTGVVDGIPDAFRNRTELFTGGAVKGWWCWEVSVADVDSLQLLVKKRFEDRTRIWFNLW